MAIKIATPYGVYGTANSFAAHNKSATCGGAGEVSD